MNKTIHELAELQPNIQMAQAVYLDGGPYSDIRGTVNQISQKYLDSKTANDEDDVSDLAVEDQIRPVASDQRCPKCKEFFPYHAIAFHANSCSEPLRSSNVMASASKTNVSSRDDFQEQR